MGDAKEDGAVVPVDRKYGAGIEDSGKCHYRKNYKAYGKGVSCPEYNEINGAASCQGKIRGVCKRMQLLQAGESVFYRGLFGGYYGNDFLPDYNGASDEPQQCSLWPFQYCMGTWMRAFDSDFV